MKLNTYRSAVDVECKIKYKQCKERDLNTGEKSRITSWLSLKELIGFSGVGGELSALQDQIRDERDRNG